MTRALYNHPILKDRRKVLRKESTDTEKLLWGKLRNKQLQGLKFWRQYSVGPYILDFFCPKKRLAIELDGGHHAESEIIDYDRERSRYLEANDIKVLRFWNSEVSTNLSGVLEKIWEELDTPSLR